MVATILAPVWRRISLTTFLVLLLLDCVGCRDKPGPSTDHGSTVYDRNNLRQQRICKELGQLGALCDANFGWPYSYAHITLGKQWSGGDQGVALLLQLDRVDEITLAGEFADSALLAGIAAASGLSVLHVEEAAVSSEGMSGLSRVANLVGLDLRQVDLSEDAWNHVCQLDPIWLSIESTADVFGQDILLAGRWKRLFSLRLLGSGISDVTLLRIGGLTTVLRPFTEPFEHLRRGLSSFGRVVTTESP